MKKYLIKETTTATENNANFKGITKIFYIGKKEHSLEGDKYLNYHFVHNGFTTKAAATKALKHYQDNVNWFNDEYKTWNSIFEIIEKEV